MRALSGDAADEAVEGEDATAAEPSTNGSEPDAAAEGDAPLDLEGLQEGASEVAEK